MGLQKTPLFRACEHGHPAAAKVLMKNKAKVAPKADVAAKPDVAAQEDDKFNCLDVAVKNGHKYVVHCTFVNSWFE